MLSDVFSKRLRELRIERNLTLQNVGDAVQSTRHTIGNLEYGRKLPSLDMVIALANYFDVSIDYLVGLTDDPHTQVSGAIVDASPILDSATTKSWVTTTHKLPSGREITLTEEQLRRMRRIEANLQEAVAFADECHVPVEEIFPQFGNRRSDDPARR